MTVWKTTFQSKHVFLTKHKKEILEANSLLAHTHAFILRLLSEFLQHLLFPFTFKHMIIQQWPKLNKAKIKNILVLMNNFVPGKFNMKVLTRE